MELPEYADDDGALLTPDTLKYVEDGDPGSTSFQISAEYAQPITSQPAGEVAIYLPSGSPADGWFCTVE